MAIVRQMPKLYLRGSLANITMANLTPKQKDHIAEVFDRVTKHPDMQRHKIGIMKELGVTIAADYANDRATAEQEYKIAIWRGITDLFYHHKYTFKCRACNQTAYHTKRSKPKPIDRQQIPCPSCHKVEITDTGDVKTLKVGQHITHDEFQQSYADMPDGFVVPKCKSAIDAIPGEKKYENPDDIINDDKQLRKFFGEFVWNYFRQQIKENKRTEHRKELVSILGDTDYLFTQMIISLCNEMLIDYNYCEKTEPSLGVYSIRLCGAMTPPEFTAEFSRLKMQAANYGINIRVTPQSIEVVVNPDAPQMPTQERRDKNGQTERWQALVYRPEHVNVLDSITCISEDQENDYSSISQLSHRTVEGMRMDVEDHVESVDNVMTCEEVRSSIPMGECRKVFDIWMQQGDVFADFSAKYGDGQAKINHIAEFLNATPRAINTYKQTIQLHCLAKGFVPVSRR